MKENFGEHQHVSSNKTEREIVHPDEVEFEPSDLLEKPGLQKIYIRDLDGSRVGSVEVYFKNEPVPHFKISEMYINPGEKTRGHGYGSVLLEFVQDKLRELNRPGLLRDMASTNPDNHEAVAGIYERHGWTLVPGTEHTFVYNLTDGVEASVFTVH